MPTGTRILSMLALAMLTASACGKSDAPPSSRPPSPPQAAAPPATQAAGPPAAAAAPFQVVSISFMNNAGPKPTGEFAPNDTIFAVIKTDGTAPKVELKGRWTYQDGQLVNESDRTIAIEGPATTEFHIAKPSGFPTGKYKFELLANGKSMATRDFSVD